MVCNGKTKQHRQIRSSGVFRSDPVFRCSGVLVFLVLEHALETWILCWSTFKFSYNAIVFCFCLSDFARWGFDITMQRKFVSIFDDGITQKETLNSKMFSCWESECVSFFRELRREFQCRLLYNDNWKNLFCNKSIKIYDSTNLSKNAGYKRHFVWPNVHSGKFFKLIMLVKYIKSKAGGNRTCCSVTIWSLYKFLFIG